jgi:TolB protein
MCSSLVFGPAQASQPELRSTFVITSNRDNLSLPQPTDGAEIYLMNTAATDVQRLTFNTSEDIFPVLSPDGKRIVFDSLRRHPATDPPNPPAPSDLFLMNSDGKGQRFLTTGSSATWSPDGKRIAFHASASGSGTPINRQPGAATYDSDIFVANVDDLLDQGPEHRTNITNSPRSIDSDADWSPDGKMIVFTIQPTTDDNPPKPSGPPKLHIMNADGTGLRQLPDTGGPEIAPDWSPDGTRIAFMCRLPVVSSSIDICVMTLDGSKPVARLTDVSSDPAVGPTEASPSWSPDGTQILFHREGNGTGQKLWVMNADGSGQRQLTNTDPKINDGRNGYASWGLLRVTSP